MPAQKPPITMSAGIVYLIRLNIHFLRSRSVQLARQRCGKRDYSMPARDPATLLRSLLEASPFGVIVLNTEGRVRLWSPGAERMFGWREEEVLDRPLEPELLEGL